MSRIVVISFFAIIWTLDSFGQSKNQVDNTGFILSCTFEGMPDGTKVYLRTQEQDTVAKAISKGDHFMFKGILPLNGRFHFIVIDTLISDVISEAVFVENRHMQIGGSVGERDVKISDAVYQRDYYNYNKIGQSFTLQFNAIKVAKDRESKQKKLNEEFKQAVRVWLANHRSSLVAPWFIKARAKSDLDGMLQAYEALSPEAKASYYGVLAKQELDIQKAAKEIKEGNVIPDFKIETPDGKTVNMLQLASKSKYTLVDFWASWCVPCRKEVPALKALFAAYRDKGLNIVGVSTDRKRTDWERAVLDDGTSWDHGIEKQSGEINSLFSLGAIPAYMLIDQQGRMLAFDCAASSIPSFGGKLRGEDLVKKIEELLGK